MIQITTSITRYLRTFEQQMHKKQIKIKRILSRKVKRVMNTNFMTFEISMQVVHDSYCIDVENLSSKKSIDKESNTRVRKKNVFVFLLSLIINNSKNKRLTIDKLILLHSYLNLSFLSFRHFNQSLSLIRNLNQLLSLFRRFKLSFSLFRYLNQSFFSCK